MNISEDILRPGEIAVLRLRELFRDSGYGRYELSKFEDYELYASNRSFIGADDIITFTDSGGRLKALRPDVTLSIVKNAPHSGAGVTRLYYDGNVYRHSGLGRELRERVQSGLECMGEIGAAEMSEIISLAVKSLATLGVRGCIDISHLGLLGAVLERVGLSHECETEALRRIGEKNLPELERLLVGADTVAARQLLALVRLGGSFSMVCAELTAICTDERTRAAAQELQATCEGVLRECPDADIRIDFSVVNDMGYYDGVIFQGYAEGIPAPVLSGGRYDRLLRKLGQSGGAIGFAVYIDLLEHESEVKNGSDGLINVALPKGRLGETVYGMMDKAGYGCPDILEDSRRLVFENAETGVRYFWVKPSDVAIYVERGVADIGIAGSDIIMEHTPEVYELCDLGVGVCRLAVAAPKGYADNRSRELRVATKFVEVAKAYYAAQSREIDVIELNGSVELAPLLGLSDVIVDIVETGTTLRENGLEIIAEVAPVSARLIANKSGYKFKNEAVTGVARALSEVVK